MAHRAGNMHERDELDKQAGYCVPGKSVPRDVSCSSCTSFRQPGSSSASVSRRVLSSSSRASSFFWLNVGCEGAGGVQTKGSVQRGRNRTGITHRLFRCHMEPALPVCISTVDSLYVTCAWLTNLGNWLAGNDKVRQADALFLLLGRLT